ncbi:cation diffusion facilitator family transporter [Paenibacillus sp. LMG 31456]|uniref:Cation diffusion facilitator family transporter n=1 Tax=Paenibacillus foliorum TaxID=2654974 RepID=A0A972H014_9BACL|nr:cation diffusion facilitator family transporter [Paenibacillus foliorum]NOU96060.1 cation diffusion facilitator family transporter [Paenibacillus foliorum]
MTNERFKKTEFAVWIGIACNLALAVMKGAVGYISGSKALLADALHTASEAASAFAGLTKSIAAKSSSDKDHPYGSVKAESITAIVVSVLLLLVGIEVFISSARAIYIGIDSPPEKIAFIAIVISIITKEAIFQYKSRWSKPFSSQAPITHSWERRSEIYSSIAALVGTGGSIWGHYLGNKYMYYLDPIAGVVIAVLIFIMGYRILKNAILKKMTPVHHSEDPIELLRTVQMIKGVIAVDDLRARERGHYVIIDVKISVNPRISVLEGHDVAKIVKQTLMKRFIHISDVYIQVQPYDPGYPYKNNVGPEYDDHSSLLH